jgi:hypothetical protein
VRFCPKDATPTESHSCVYARSNINRITLLQKKVGGAGAPHASLQLRDAFATLAESALTFCVMQVLWNLHLRFCDASTPSQCALTKNGPGGHRRERLLREKATYRMRFSRSRSQELRGVRKVRGATRTRCHHERRNRGPQHAPILRLMGWGARGICFRSRVVKDFGLPG